MKALDDITLKKVFLRVFNRLYRNKEAILKPFMENVQKALLDGLKSESAKTIDARLEDITGQMKQLIRQQIKEDVDPTVFQNEYRKLKAQLDKLREERNKIGLMDDKHEEILKRTEKIYDYLQDMEDMLTEFDDDIFGAMVEHILVISPTHLKFELKNGLVLEEKFIKKKGYMVYSKEVKVMSKVVSVIPAKPVQAIKGLPFQAKAGLRLLPREY